MLTNHLELIRQSRAKQNLALDESKGYSSMEIIDKQSLLMAAGGMTFKALNTGEMVDILAGLTHLAYLSAEALVCSGREIAVLPPPGYQAYEMLTIMQMLSEKIHFCSSGKTECYIDLYHCCAALAANFLNADFEKAFAMLHQWRLNGKTQPALTICDCAMFPDLTDCLYE